MFSWLALLSGTALQIALSASWPLPQATDISSAYEQSYIAAFPGCDPTQPNNFMGVQARTHGIVGFNLYLYQRSLADELMADTARAWLARHGAQWGVPQIPAQAAIGNVIFSGPPGLPLPSGIEMADDNSTQFITNAAAVVGAAPAGSTTGTVSVAVTCEVAGAAGNEAAGTVLTIVSPILGLQNQTVTVDAGGIAGGTDAETIESWRARILLRIQKRGQAGNAADYTQWAEQNGAAASPNIIGKWIGPGSTAIVFARPNPNGADRLVPTLAQVAAMQTAIDALCPVTDQAVVLAAVQTAVPLTMALATDTVDNRTIAQQAAQNFIAAVAIGGLLDHSELTDAVLQAVSCGVEISQPAGNVQAGATQMFIASLPPTFVVYA